MNEMLEKVSQDLGVPVDLLRRAAAARAAAMGDSAEALVARWAGEAPAAAPAAAETSAPAPAAAETTAPAPAAAEPEAPAAPPPVAADTPAPAAASPAPPPPPPEVADEEEDEPVASPFAGFPRWLVASFVLLPLIAVAYALVAPNGPDCGTSGKLGIDPVSGVGQSCDGSAFGSSGADYFSAGMDLYTGATCNVCHGDSGQGAVGPAFSGGAVLVTFPAGSCSDHVEWVRLGTDGWPDATYGATSKPVGGSGAKMPSFANQLSDEELRSVVLYERVAFGGEPLAEAETDCGLVAAD
jgi:mono/diheme cytochrome c family protein